MHGTYWNPACPGFTDTLKEAKSLKDPAKIIAALRALSRYDLDVTQIAALDRFLQSTLSLHADSSRVLPGVKLAFLGSFTIEHLVPSIRVAALRRGLLATVYTCGYGQQWQDLMDPASAFHRFAPDVVLLSVHHNDINVHLPFTADRDRVQREVHAQLEKWSSIWEKCKHLGAAVIQSTVAIPADDYFGHFDSHVPASVPAFLGEFNRALVARAAENNVPILDAERIASRVGKAVWFNEPLWFHAKQAVPQALAPLYGDHVARLLAAVRGVSSKCLVLDLDNTLWGGVVGDDGVDGIVIGQGDAVGEAFQAFQSYLKSLWSRGVILAVCSKNERANAQLPFEKHPEMRLKISDFSCFVANWEDKAKNLRSIAAALNIGLDSLVFFDDNPAERALVRRELPEVAVPEVPEDPAAYLRCLSDAGFFESVGFTKDDARRNEQYAANTKREELQQKAADIAGFLASLSMEMRVGPFDGIGLSRIVQLINKSNQFNLTTRRYSESQARKIMEDPSAIHLQVRLKDNCGDNGMISVVIARPSPDFSDRLIVDTWLMSCRVLGRQVEHEILNALVETAESKGFRYIEGHYFPTEKNGLVRDHFEKLGFRPMPFVPGKDGSTAWELDVKGFEAHRTSIRRDRVYAEKEVSAT